MTHQFIVELTDPNGDMLIPVDLISGFEFGSVNRFCVNIHATESNLLDILALSNKSMYIDASIWFINSSGAKIGGVNFDSVRYDTIAFNNLNHAESDVPLMIKYTFKYNGKHVLAGDAA